MSTQPTDALELLREIYADLMQGAIPNADDLWWQKASAALAGAPAPVGVEPVALLVRKNSWRDGQWEAAPPNSPSYGLAWANQRVYVYTTPQPTQPQAGAVPLTPDQIAEIADAAHREYDRLVSSGQCAPRWSAVFAHLLRCTTASKEASMALSEAQIYDIATDWFVDGWAVARAIKMVEQVEAEVRKQDEALIQQLVEALESVDGAMPFPVARQVLKVARARLGGKP